jgi:hypothetical protein
MHNIKTDAEMMRILRKDMGKGERGSFEFSY